MITDNFFQSFSLFNRHTKFNDKKRLSCKKKLFEQSFQKMFLIDVFSAQRPIQTIYYLARTFHLNPILNYKDQLWRKFHDYAGTFY